MKTQEKLSLNRPLFITLFMTGEQSGLMEKVANTKQSEPRRSSRLIYSTRLGFLDRNFEKILSLAEKYFPTHNQNYHPINEN